MLIVLIRLLSVTRHGAAALLAVLVCASADAQLRIVSYNTAGAPRDGMDIVLRSMGEYTVNGLARPIDILLLQEQTFPSHTQAFVDLMNTMYVGQTGDGLPITYARGDLGGTTTGAGTQSIVYRTQTVQLLGEVAIGSSDTSGQPRQAIRHHVQPFGYFQDDFYIYNSHYKADQGSVNEDRRLQEALAIRNDADALGAGQHIIYAGDFNMYTAGEAAFQTLVAPGNGQAFDPLGLTDFDNNSNTTLSGEWHKNQSPAVRAQHTQSPCLSGCMGSTGGMDDRFDFQLVSGAFLSGQGLTLLAGSYLAFGNNGSTYGTNINSPSNTVTFPGVTSYTTSQILDALWSVSDHLPVMADYDFAGPPHPHIIAKWTFETLTIDGNQTPAATYGPVAPEEGSGAAHGRHASASTAWSTPVGNGSAKSFSSNNWAVGDSYEFQVSTLGVGDIQLTFDQASSNTGPRDFRIDYSTDGVDFNSTDFTYSVLANASPNPSWTSTSIRTEYAFSFDLSGITALNNQESIFLRLVVDSNIRADGTGTIQAGGTSRVDNVAIIGTNLVGVPGDFNGDGVVDAADYVWWRANDGSPAGYETWRENFGATAGGSGSRTAASAAVPEPAAAMLLVLGGCLAALRRGTLRAVSNRGLAPRG